MAAKAALEESHGNSTYPVPKIEDTQIPVYEISDAESFHSTHSNIATPKPTRRRTMSDPKALVSSSQARTGTWPRSARSSISQHRSRPSIPKRRSSHFTITSQKRPDLLAFHRESCQLFSSMDATITDSGYSSVHRPSTSRFSSTTSVPELSTLSNIPSRRSREIIRPHLSTVISWKSEETRRIEYDKIDRAHSGLRGLTKKLLPKFCQSKSWRDFFGGKCDGDSVRRYRMPFSDDEEDRS
jgi:hypothetical protein